jgi:class 3 adenylate cyclase/formylglycine-generating enzyme required for sulfatase activity/predicted esterase
VSPAETRSHLLCLVFTDLVDSTGLKARLGDRVAGELIERHHEEVRRLIDSAGGREIDSAGDGFFLTFESPSAAVRFALQLQEIHHARPEMPAVRVGIHLGEVTERPAPAGSSKPMLVEGLAVDVAARIGGLASPGQVLMSGPVFNAARQRLDADAFPRPVAWRAHGPYLLRGYDEPLQISEAGIEGLSPLGAPGDSEKARSAVAAGDELTLGWRPAVGLAIPGREHWRLDEQLGTGAIGEVWVASHGKTHAKRVFKFCFQADQLRTLRREVVLLRLLRERLGSRDDIAQVLDWEFDHPPYFLEVEHSDAGDLVAWAREQGGIEKVPMATRLDIVVQLAGALAAAHGAGVLHKDLKPANVLVTEDAQGGPRVCLTDFGIGLVTSREVLEIPGVTVAGLTEALLSSGGSTGAGTRLYMAPEVLEGREATPQADVYSLGVILYQIVVADFGRALGSGWEREVDDPLLRDDIAACVDRDLDKRLPDPASLAERLQALSERRAGVRRGRTRRRMWIGAAAAVVLVVLGVAGSRGFQLWSVGRWARDVATPEMMRLIQVADWPAAFVLGTEIERRVGADPRLDPMWRAISVRVSFETEPPGATISYKPYADLEGEWTSLGVSPVENVRVPRGVMRWRVEKAGYESRELAFRAPVAGDMGPGSPFQWTPRFALDPAGSTPTGMVAVEGGHRVTVPLRGFQDFQPYELDRFYIGRTEVTNAEYKEFVDAGGYAQREFWKQAFVKDGRTLSFEEAMSHFVDSAGRAGPSTWILGEYPKGQGDHPVGGVSWFEAAAYAEFRGQSLPTVYHWAAAALPSTELAEPLADALIPFSNLAGSAAEPVASRPAISVAGAYDMAGNVREWTANAAGNRRYLLGGGWTDPTYFFGDAATESPWARRSTYGIRLAAYPAGEPPESLRAAFELPDIDFRAIETWSEETWEVWSDLVSYEPTPLNVAVESRRELPDGIVEERVTLDAPVSGERLILYVFTHQDQPATRPAVIFFPGSSMTWEERDTSSYVDANYAWLQFIPKSGRVLVLPIYAGCWERNDGRTAQRFAQYGSRRDLVFEWVREVSRTIDYLAERPDADGEQVAYLGVSLGAILGPHFAAWEPRLDSLLLYFGGFTANSSYRDAEILVQALRRTTAPVLMLNGRYDILFPQPNQQAFFDLLATPDAEKRRVLVDAGHGNPPYGAIVRETLGWLDRTLGPVVPAEG